MRILVMNGPNLNMLGRREPNIYGSVSLSAIETLLSNLAKSLSVELEMFQSNIEGELVERIQKTIDENFDGILINPGAYGHTSIALRDALSAVALPFIEVHMSNVYAREEFRHKSYLSDISAGVIVGMGTQSYLLGLRGLVESLRAKKKS